ncbi:TPR domain-containing protein [Colletotrichum sojae]|uniref:TPR domain-containing protein n=1 Tax=Colletotrichum sojae TaxID=2175907 RepID=A0A8H6IS12_9PEZI|nr:TPR domain-containing protein [Colletotrichum sojae]
MADLEEAITITREAIEATPQDHPDRAKWLNNLGSYLGDRFDRTGAMADLEEAITITRYSRTGAMADLEEAATIAREAVEATPKDDPDRAARLNNLGSHLGDRYSRIGAMADLEESITITREAVEATPKDHPDRTGRLNNLGIRLSSRYSRTGAMADLEESITITREAVETTPKDHPNRATLLNNLGNRLGSRYSRTGAITDLEEAITITREAIKATPQDHPDRATWLNNLGSHLGDRYNHTRAMADLEEATTIAREAVEATPKDHPDRAGRLNNLGIRLSSRYSRTGAMADLEEAITITREAIETTPKDHPGRARRLNNLGSHLGDRYSRTGAITDLEEAITITREAIKATPQDHPDRATWLNNLGNRLGSRYSRTGAMADLEEAITIAREAVKATPQDYPDRAAWLNNLGSHLADRYSRTGAMADLEEAITIAREAIKATPKNHPDRATQLNNLGSSLSDRYNRTKAMADLEEAITIAQEAIKATPKDHPGRATWLNNLGIRLSSRYSRTGAMADLEESITIAREAVETTPKDHPGRATQLSNLGSHLSDRYSRTGAIADLKEAIAITREAVEATPQDHPDRVRRLNNLGIYLSDRFDRTGAMADLEEANLRFAEALYTKEAQNSERIRGGRRYLSSPSILQNTHDVYAIANLAVGLIPLLSTFSLQSADKQFQLRQAVGLASDAAAITLHTGHGPLAALQLLETGRGVLASSLQNIRTDLSTLQQEHPDLARAFVHLRNQLDSPAQRHSLKSSQLPSEKPASIDPDGRHKASVEMDILLGDIRSRPGFERFLTSATEEEMRETAAYGPVVVINISLHRCDALVVERSGVRVLALPQLTLDGLKERTSDLRSVATLAWLWDVAVGPVLDTLGFTAPPTGDTWPHVWWVPTGPLTQFPLHAAGHHTKCSAETALDRVVSSYSPTIKSILHTRRQRRLDVRANSNPNVVLVDMQETPGQSRLLHATRETDAVRDVFESIGLPYHQPSANKKDVLVALDNCRILHFAGHGGARPDPLQSLLLLQDWENNPLTVESLLETNSSAEARFLAYLSACGTGQVQDERSIDESIHLTSAFQLAGFRHVIGTLWEVDDELCVDMARLTYEFFAAKGLRDESVSRGLHYATKKLRDTWIQQQMGTESMGGTTRTGNRDVEMYGDPKQDRPMWVPYVHFGV